MCDPPEERVVDADVDGDDAEEHLIFRQVTNAAPRAGGCPRVSQFDWRITGALTSGGTIDDPVFATWNPRPIGVTDLDRNGRDEVWVDEGNGATAFSVGLVVYDSGRMRPVTDRDSTDDRPADLLWSQSSNSCIGLVVGVGCSDMNGDGRYEIVATEHDAGLARTEGGDQEQTKPETWGFTTLALSGTTLHEVRHVSGLRKQPDLRGVKFESGVSCQTIHYP
jgi:hypothetical protein